MTPKQPPGMSQHFKQLIYWLRLKMNVKLKWTLYCQKAYETSHLFFWNVLSPYSLACGTCTQQLGVAETWKGKQNRKRNGKYYMTFIVLKGFRLDWNDLICISSIDICLKNFYQQVHAFNLLFFVLYEKMQYKILIDIVEVFLAMRFSLLLPKELFNETCL